MNMCCVVLRCVVLCCVALCCVVLRCVALCCVALCCVALRCAVLCCVVLRCFVLSCVALRCVVLCCVALRCFVLCCVVGICVPLMCRRIERLKQTQVVCIIVYTSHFNIMHPPCIWYIQISLSLFPTNCASPWLQNLTLTYCCNGVLAFLLLFTIWQNCANALYVIQYILVLPGEGCKWQPERDAVVVCSLRGDICW